MCCLICILIDKDKLTADEAFKAANGGERVVEVEHVGTVLHKIDELRRKEEKAIEDFDQDDYLNGGD